MQVFIADRAMDEPTCRLVQAAMDAGVPEPAEVLAAEVELVRHGRLASLIEVPTSVLDRVGVCLDAHRDAVSAFFGRPLRSREGVSLLRYRAGGFYGPHVDRADAPCWPQAANRQITVVLFLDSSRERDPDGGFSGGRLCLFPEGPESPPIAIVPARGTLVAFPSSTFHEVTPVLHGTRDAVVDWFV